MECSPVCPLTANIKVKIVAVVVTFEPTIELLDQQWDALSPQVEKVVIVDNHSSVDVSSWLRRKGVEAAHAIVLEKNYGIAKAQNVGIAWARAYGATHVLLMDQDSVPAIDMVRELLCAAWQCSGLAAVGPSFSDTGQDSPPSFVRMRGLLQERVTCESGCTVVPVDYLIASGCLIPIATLDRVGNMREDFFIDSVDIEWCLRAKWAGLQCYGVFTAKMRHTIGGAPMRIFGRTFPVHSPIRQYYQVRNRVLLYWEPWVPLSFKWADGWRLAATTVLFALFVPPRKQRVIMMLRGLLHGLVRRTGSYHQPIGPMKS